MNAFEVKITHDSEEIRAAQRLRFDVFNRELHKGLQASHELGLDIDPFDGVCDHLLARDTSTGKVIGTYRLLLGSNAGRNFGFYSENEFDLKNIKKLDGELLELGRSCVHKKYRDRGVLDVMWQAIAEYVRKHGVRYLFGCASLYSTDPGGVSELFSVIKRQYYAPETFRVLPVPGKLFRNLIETLKPKNGSRLPLRLPGLINGYFKLGALVCGPPALDDDFGTSDLFLLLDIRKLNDKNRERFRFSATQGARCG